MMIRLLYMFLILFLSSPAFGQNIPPNPNFNPTSPWGQYASKIPDWRNPPFEIVTPMHGVVSCWSGGETAENPYPLYCYGGQIYDSQLTQVGKKIYIDNWRERCEYDIQETGASAEGYLEEKAKLVKGNACHPTIAVRNKTIIAP